MASYKDDGARVPFDPPSLGSILVGLAEGADVDPSPEPSDGVGA